MRNVDAVLSSFGPKNPMPKTDRHVPQRVVGALCSAVQSAGLSRLVIVSSALLFKDAVIPPAALVGRLFFHDVTLAEGEMEQAVTSSGLSWTIVRPPQLNNGAHTGKYRIREGHLPLFGFGISRANAADFLLKGLQNPAYVGKVIGIAS